MTYDAQERSFQGGAPVELYLFARGLQVWRYTSADSDITFDGETWTAAVIRRSSVETSPEQPRNAMQITAPRELAVADLFRVTSPTDVISVTIYRYHRTDLAEESAVLWIGRVLNVAWQGAQAVMSCEPVSISFGRTGLRRNYQRACPHVLYGAGCTLDKADFSRVCEVTNISGNNLTVDAVDAMPYAGGFVEFEVTAGNIERRFIRTYSGGTLLVLAQPFQDLEVGDTVTIYPGCDHTMQTCDTSFGNIDNYGGMPWIPIKNPFDGTPIF